MCQLERRGKALVHSDHLSRVARENNLMLISADVSSETAHMG